MTRQKKYIIGIDLGTTNCTMAYAACGEESINQYSIPQITASGVQGEHLSLPSFVYLPLHEELKSKVAGIEWDPTRKYCVGVFARERGSELSDRMIASAKSWLCHSGIDRREKLLPVAAEDASIKMSPLEACSKYIHHLKEAWDQQHPKDPFCDQQILITVPASFDPSARQLVQEAAEIAGCCDAILIEEPQAAFYSWLYKQGEEWRKQLRVGDKVLVVDIGGGTTDFSLISVAEEEGNLVLERIAVGNHLLLGGDNIDLSLAYLAKDKLEEAGHDIDEWQLNALQYACRRAKEQLLAEDPPESVDVTIMGRGSGLIGGTLTVTLDRSEITHMILEGFMPMVASTERSTTERRSGMQQVGLPYAQDARISCQLAKFLSMTGEGEDSTMDKFIMPTALLFNGGTMKAAALRQRIVDLLNSWAETMGAPSVKLLPDHDYDYAVSQGAAFYGMARSGKAIRIKSGTNRSYYIGVEDAMPAVPGREPPMKAICVVPFGMEEGTEGHLPEQEFALVLGEQARFRFFSHATATLSDNISPIAGTVVKNWKKELSELHPIEAMMDRGENDGKTVRVSLKSHVTELGVLELWCEAADKRRWKLEFDIRSPQ